MNKQNKLLLYLLASALLFAPLVGLGIKRNHTELTSVAAGWFGLRDIFDTLKEENKILLLGGKEIRYGEPLRDSKTQSEIPPPVGEKAYYGKEKPDEDSWGIQLLFRGFTKFFQSLFSTLETLFGWFAYRSGKS